MSDSAPPLLLLFGPHDPSGSGHLPADAITCATLGGHALSTLTAIHVQDTAGLEEIHELPAELIDDQARCLLEDMNVGAIKVGTLYNTDTVRVLAQIAADYSHLPLILHAGSLPEQLPPGEDEPEDVLAAMLELLLPQTDLLLIEHALAARWQAEGLIPDAMGATPAHGLLECGARWVLSSATPLRPGQHAYLLLGPQKATFNWRWQAPATRLSNPDGPLACALTLQLAQGVAMPQATQAAIGQAQAITASTFQAGMGPRLINQTRPQS